MVLSKKKRIGVLDDARWSKPISAFGKKFPDFMPDLEKVPGYQEMVLKAHEHLAELEPFYAVLIDLCDWNGAAIDLLKELAAKCAAPDLSAAPDYAAALLDLLRLVVRLHLCLKDWGAANVIKLATTYYRMYYHHKCAQEPNYSKISAWVLAYQDGVAELGVQLAPLAQPLGVLLAGAFAAAYGKTRDFSRLTKDGVFSLTVKHDDLAQPADDDDRWLALHYGDLYEWLVCALIGVPQLLENAALADLVKEALSKGGYCLQLYRTRFVYVHEELDAICKESRPSKTLAKQRKAIQQYGKEAIASFPHHQEARIFTALAARALVTLGSDVPGLLAPKIGQFLGITAMARYELHWLLMHSTVPPPSDYRRYKPEDVKDQRWCIELVALCCQIAALLRRFAAPIGDYYEQFCRGADLDTLARVAAASDAALDVDAVRAAIADGDFIGAHDAWRRGQFAALTGAGARRLDELARVHKVARHALLADALADEVTAHASPALAWWWTDAFNELLESSVNCLDGDSARHAMAFVKALSDVPGLATPFFSKERERLGKEAVNAANKALIKITKRICFLLHDIAMTHMRLDHMLAEINAVHQVFRKVNRDWKPPKDYQPQPLPGDESKYAARGQGDAAKLRQLQRSCFLLCAAINEQSAVAVYNHAFSPREFLREKLHLQLVNFMRTCVAADDKAGTIQRPTVLERRIGIYSATLQEVEHFVAIDTGELLRDAFLGEVYSPTCGVSGSMDYVSRKPEPQQGSMVAILTDWYADFALNSLPRAAAFSPSRKAFVSRSSSAVPYEQWTDLSELAALARLVGPYGVKQFDQRLLAVMAQRIETVRTALVNNSGPLAAIAKNYFSGPAVSDAVKRIRDLDGAIQELVHLGALQQMRRILREGLQSALDQSLPFVHRTCELAYNNYEANRAREAGLLSMDALAADAGVNTFDADPAFLTLLSPTAADENWDLLPYLFAASFYSSAVQGAVFNSSTNGCDNNAHCMPFAVVDLVVGVAGLRKNDERKLRRRVEHLLEVGAAQVLRLVEGAKDGAVKNYADLPAVVILMDAALIASNGLADRATLERVLPYNLARQCFTEAYDRK
jgi:NCK-associated protein 1